MRTLIVLFVLSGFAASLASAPAPESLAPAQDADAPSAVSRADAERLFPDMLATRKDGESGSRFPVFLPDPAYEREHLRKHPSDRWLMLTGTGVREKFFFDVYTVGLYLDPLRVHHELADFRGDDAKALSKNADLYRALANDALPKLLRLEMNRDVDAEDMREAFQDSLASRIKKLAKSEAERTAGMRGLETFKALFGTRTRQEGARSVTVSLKELREGAVLLFAFSPGGVLDVTISQTSKSGSTTSSSTFTERIESPLLSAALLDVYVGKDPVVSSAKKAFAKGLPEVFARGKALAEAGYPWPRAEAEAQVERDAADDDAEDDGTAR